MDFHLASYSKHKSLLHEEKLSSTWKNLDTVDYWRHKRMYDNLLPLLQAYPGASWLTIGDGRYGTDANFLLRNGAQVIATDINDTLLKKAKEEGFIKEFKQENAENLSFGDQSFDFVLCKESYHHFPRPILALYEMLRVSRMGVLLIEPQDHEIVNPYTQKFYSGLYWFWQAIKRGMKYIMNKQSYIPKPMYEPAGNFVYSISHRELQKIALGMNLPGLALKGINDFYLEGVENERVADQGPLLTALKNKLIRADAISKRRPEQYGLLAAYLFKTLPSEESKKAMKDYGFTLHVFESNPYL